MFFHIHIIAIIPCIDARLFIHTRMISIDFRFTETTASGKTIAYRHTTTYIRLFAIIAGFILQTFDIQVVGIDFNTFTFYLAPNKVCITTALYCGLAVGVTHMACHISGFITVTIAFTSVSTHGNSGGNAITKLHSHSHVKAA